MGVKDFLKKNKSRVVFFLLISILIFGALAYVNLQRRIPSKVEIRQGNFKAYWDADCTQEITLVDWGVLEQPPTHKTITIWLKNLGNVDLNITMTTEDWNPPEASNYLFLTWDSQGRILHAGESWSASLTLSVSGDVITTGIKDFSFTIVFTGTETS